ncbi:MAG TPA: dienelactone hydrolase family protein [Reyranella sp.]|jgi:dienelactone hydrolase|nr:dienelactone hydrolase family protein [Reyranella sp.]
MHRLLTILLLVLGTANAAAQTVHFPSITVGNATAGPELTGWLYRPPGAGAFPAIVLAHTCGGVSEHTNAWGKLLSGWGYVVLAPDSFRPRGVSQVCANGMTVSGNARVADVAGALDFLNSQPFVRKGDVGLIGHSHGGWTTMRAVQRSFGLASRGLNAAVAYYPSCNAAFDRDVAVPLLILIGDRDDWTSSEQCRALQRAGFARPELVDAVYYPKAYHSFDSNVPDRTYLGHHLGYDPIAAADAEVRTRAFFGKYLR